MNNKLTGLSAVLQCLIDEHRNSDEPYWLGYCAALKAVIRELEKNKVRPGDKPKEKIINWKETM